MDRIFHIANNDGEIDVCEPAHSRPRGSASRQELDARANAAMLRYSRGDARAFDELHRLLGPRLLGMCRRLTRPDDAEELVQEVFLKIHRARASFDPQGSVAAWAFTIARTTFLDRVRKFNRRPRMSVKPLRVEQRAAPDTSSPELLMNQRAIALVLDREFGALSEKLRTAYTLVKLDGLSCAAAGEQLEVTPSAVKQRVHRANEELKAGLMQWAS